MAVQQLDLNRIIIRKDTSTTTLYPTNQPKQFESTSIYEEPIGNKSGNIDINELATLITANLLDGQVLESKPKAIEVDIQREIQIGTIDKNAVQSEIIPGKVNTKVDKLKALRKNR